MDHPRPNKSGDIHLSLFYYHMLFLSKNKFIFALVCNIVYAGQLFMTKSDIIPRRWRHANIFWHRWLSLLNGLPQRLTTPWPSLETAPAYNAVAVSRDRAGLQCRGRLLRPRRLTARRTTHTSAIGLQCDGQLTRPPLRPTRRPRC